ncbi:hypothetical protein [Lacrimispora sp.]|uniref:hypothetical protein n=1 Tax=Lacrimispora sp. TaxID=2719234 RepID=UPI00345F9D26
MLIKSESTMPSILQNKKAASGYSIKKIKSVRNILKGIIVFISVCTKIRITIIIENAECHVAAVWRQE